MHTGVKNLLSILFVLIIIVQPVFAAAPSQISPPSISSETISSIHSPIPEVKPVLDRTVLSRQISTISPPASTTPVVNASLKTQPDTSITGPLASENYTTQENQSSSISSYRVSQVQVNGKTIDQWITGPGLPPKAWQINQNLPNKSTMSASSLTLSNVPTMTWTYGCSATAATMLFGYYDRTSFPNIYTGPTNGGVFPLTNAVWGSSSERSNFGQCPMTASQYGLDGRSTKGHRDDYYYSYGSRIDPYYTGSWVEHSPKDSVADFMGTNMNQQFSNTDGSTTFWFTGDGSPLEDYTGCEPGSRDGMHGMHLFAESRGYTVTRSYNQYITGFYSWFTDGFTYDKYKAEIDAGYPVIIQLNGHSVLGIGYYSTNGMVIHDTWDYSDHTMTWGGYYANMQHYAVGVIHLAPAPDPLQAKFYGVPDAVVSPLTIHFYDASTGSPTSWNWNFGEGGNVTTRNATHTYTTPGTYTVLLTVSKGTSISQSNAVISYEQGIYPDA